MRTTAWVVACVLAVGVVLAACTAAVAQAQDNRISLELKDADLPSALTMLFKNTGKSFVLEGGARGTVNVSLNDVSWDQALRAVLESMNLTYRIDGDVYHIFPAGVTPPPPPPTPTGVSPPPIQAKESSSTAEGATHLGIIPVRHASVMDMAYWFGGVTAQSSVAQTPGLSGYGIGGFGAVSGLGGYGAGGYGGGVGGYGGGLGGYGGAGGYGRGGLGGYGGGVGGYGGGVGGYGGGVGGYGGGVGGLGGYGGGVGGYGGGGGLGGGLGRRF